MELDFDYDPTKLQAPPDYGSDAVTIYGIYSADDASYEYVGSVSVADDPKLAELMRQARKYQYILAVDSDSDLIEFFKKAAVH